MDPVLIYIAAVHYALAILAGNFAFMSASGGYPRFFKAVPGAIS